MSADQDKRHAQQLGITEAEVRRVREAFDDTENGRIMRHILCDVIDQKITEDDRRLRSVTKKELKGVQGHIKGLELAKVVINHKMAHT